MSKNEKTFNPPPGWPKPPPGWKPPAGWSPDPEWPELPEGWELWITEADDAIQASNDDSPILSSTTEDIETLKAEVARLQNQIAESQALGEVISLNDQEILQSIGIYQYHHPLENAAGYQSRLSDLQANIISLVKDSEAVELSTTFTLENSLAKGRKLSSDLSKLMLRAYNAEADNCIRTLRAGNVQTAKKRLEASRKAIAKLGAIMEMRISDKYHSLRLQEIELTADWLMKKYEEKEQEKENRARIREEKRVEKEFLEKQEQLFKEKQHLENAIDALLQRGDRNIELEENLRVLNEAIAQNEYRLANIRSGYVYVISNRGAFGDNVVKIGLTRRLEPNDRITELGGASVPF